MTSWWERALAWVRRVRHWLRRAIDRKRLGKAPFTIISNDCWGGEVYRHFRRPYNTPYIGLWLTGDSFAFMMAHLAPWQHERLTFDPEEGAASGHPVGRVGSARIEFLHYESEAAAAEKWLRRSSRMDMSAIRVKISDGKDGITAEHIAQVRASHKALALTADGAHGTIGVPGFSIDGAALFLPSLRAFDIVAWLRTGELRPARLYQRLLS